MERENSNCKGGVCVWGGGGGGGGGGREMAYQILCTKSEPFLKLLLDTRRSFRCRNNIPLRVQL